ncbi:hypothetical protein G7Y79_00041g077950 [Physcia stellaris]|nr:hypothetical protein G7Y79_00041g077950 [Physcia stellaris]
MVRIAIAGGTGGLGRTLVEELMQGSEHEVFILSRKTTLPFEISANINLLNPSYNSVDSLEKLLKANEIHTLISVLSPPAPEVHQIELNLIRAAAKSGTVKRFVPSEWGVDYSHDDEHLPLPAPWKALKREAIAELKKHPNLEYTSVYNGFFMDYFGVPHAPSHMLPEIPFIDIQAGKAAIPGTGDENKVALTYTKDVAKFVRRAVESTEPWPEKSVIVGDSVTLNEILQAAEKARGIKFEVVHDSLEDLRAGRITEIPAYVPIYKVLPKDFFLEMMAAFAVAMVTGVFDLGDDTLNKQYPEVKPVKTDEFITKYWAGK